MRKVTRRSHPPERRRARRLAGPEPPTLVAAGARLVREPSGEVTRWVLADPEGNEFRTFAPRPIG
ncbi:hypothetical protein DKT68_21500 [Micromonospora acroterricola]|uniref:Glyoxalase-like domain-containing protein n=1 Tax=Micromonospora acroterricola TaxID=2202421 RepID=A0A317CVX9_9ACTN|nr:VOC family protein [Micromonospora acroterricola]PWR06728.1 hypothetical protein DKT68_21500 [Micromonospora acroterricola]